MKLTFKWKNAGVAALAGILYCLVPSVYGQEVLWGNLGFSDLDPIPQNQTLNYGNGTVGISWSINDNGQNGSFNLYSASSFVRYASGPIGGKNDIIEIRFDNDSNDPGDYVQVNYVFSNAEYGFGYTILDVDEGTWADGVEIIVNGTINLKSEPDWWSFENAGASTLAEDDESYFDGFEGVNGNADNTENTGNLIVNLAGVPVTSVQFRFFSTDDADANPGGQKVGFSDLLIQRPDISNSSKEVSGDTLGKVYPGDTLTYTITLDESDGNGAYVSVADMIPAGLENVTVVSIPSGSTDNSTASQIQVDGIYVAGGGLETIVYEATVSDSVVAGTLIVNAMTASEAFGTSTTDSVSVEVLDPSEPPPPDPVSGNKPLYLRASPDEVLSRDRPEGTDFVPVSKNDFHEWSLTPTMASATVFQGDIDIQLLLKKTGQGYNRQFQLRLYNGSQLVGEIPNISINYIPDESDTAPQAYTYTIPLSSDLSLNAGDVLTLRMDHTTPYGGTRTIDVYEAYAGEYSMLSPFVETVINVDRFDAYTADYPSTLTGDFRPGDTVFLSAEVSDPFGYADISGADIEIYNNSDVLVDQGGATEIAGEQTVASKTFKYDFLLPAGAEGGLWRAVITAYEGEEGEISHSRTVLFNVLEGIELANSEKVVQDMNGGVYEPGDPVKYAITLVESAGVAGTGIQLSDPLPAGLENISSIACSDPGAVNNSTAATVGFSDISIAAGGSVTITFEAEISASAAIGSTIENIATVTDDSGNVTEVRAPLQVEQPGAAVQGNKLLYLHTNPAIEMSRIRPTSNDNERMNEGASLSWQLAPAITKATTISSADPLLVSLLISRTNYDSDRDVQVELLHNGVSVGISPVYTYSGLVANSSPRVCDMEIVLSSDVSLAVDDTVSLVVHNRSAGVGNRRIRVFQMDGGQYSYISPFVETVINVDQIGFYDDAFANGGGTLQSEVMPGDVVFVRATVSDPFGSFDITGATLDLIEPTGNKLVEGFSFAAADFVAEDTSTKTFEYQYTIPVDSEYGFWTARLKTFEGQEGTIEHEGVATVESKERASPPDLVILKTSSVISDPVNGSAVDGNNPKRIPGAVIQYRIIVTNSGEGGGDPDSIVVRDVIPPNSVMLVDDQFPASGPVQFVPGSSGLMYTYSGLSDVGDDLEFYNASGVLIVPVDSGEGGDSSVHTIRLNPKGQLNGNSTFEFKFRILLE